MTAKTLWLTGLSGAGKTTIATSAIERLKASGTVAFMVDGDQLRAGLCKGLGFSQAERTENIRRAAELAKLLNQAGITVIASMISPMATDRALAAEIIGTSFVEVFISTSLDVCQARDPKGLYAKAVSGEIPSFTGISAPYEQPANPALSINTAVLTINEAVDDVLALL